MNKQEKEKKENELLRLNTAIHNCISQKGESRRIGMLMSGIDVERRSTERPDFIRYIAPASKKDKGTVVGIELFKVDHISNLTKNNKYQSLGTIHQKRTFSYYNRWRETILNSDKIPEKSITEMCEVLSNHFNNAAYATIHTFYASFKQAVDIHMASITEYKRAIKIEADKRNADNKLIVLIDIHSSFQNLFFHHGKKVHYENRPVMFILDEFIQLLEKADNRVDYYVLSFSDTLDTSTQTVTINAKDIRSSLKKQHIPIYHYCGADLYLPKDLAFVNDYNMEMKHEEHGEEITFQAFPTMSTMRPEYKLKFIYSALRMVYYYYAKREPVVLDLDVERTLEIFFQHIVSWKKCKDDKWSYEPVFSLAPTQAYIENANEAFNQRWNLSEVLKQSISSIIDSKSQ
ncbi:hypothetical protein [uncultured Ruminococcus sp.]|uniref:hypothetical protein n=1 Tax=uncultured Ruminococcus sp. TaxID=165186 RepID=UPI0025E816D2|nr:hypothetical protein [uncultured Ruminococcus sp.]